MVLKAELGAQPPHGRLGDTLLSLSQSWDQSALCSLHKSYKQGVEQIEAGGWEEIKAGLYQHLGEEAGWLREEEAQEIEKRGSRGGEEAAPVPACAAPPCWLLVHAAAASRRQGKMACQRKCPSLLFLSLISFSFPYSSSASKEISAKLGRAQGRIQSPGHPVHGPGLNP